MSYKTRKNKRRNTSRGGNLFNFLKRGFTRSKPQLVRNSQYPPRGYSIKPSKDTDIQSITPFSENIQNISSGNYESYKDASNRMFAFVYQMYKQKDIPYSNRNYNEELIKLNSAQMKELKKAFINAMYYKGELIVNQNNSKLQNISKQLFGLKDENELDSFREYYMKVESTPPKYGNSAGKKPLRPFGFIARLIPALLKTQREINYTANQETYICSPTNYAKNTSRTLNSNECVILTRSIPALYKNLIHNPLFTDAFYMVLSPQYFPVGGESLKSKYFNTGINSTSNITVSIIMKYLHKVSFIQDAFQNAGIELFHPRLGLLIQEQMPDMWSKSYFNTKNSVTTDGKKLDIVDRIVILTLQKYAAIRRYMWTKDPKLTTQVYQVNPSGISAELRDPYSVLPTKVISIKNKDSALFDVLQKIPTYSAFDEKQFLKEFYDNQKWASNSNKIKYKSPNDSAIDKILPKNFWTLPGLYKEIEEVPIQVLPELEEVRFSKHNKSTSVNNLSILNMPIKLMENKS